MIAARFSSLFFATLLVTGCSSSSVPGSPGVPEPICVLENPETGDRVRFYKEIPFKVPAGYDEQKHIADWTAKQKDDGFTITIAPEDDRQQLAELRGKNLAASKKGAKRD
jgi:hypothetical protein